MQRCERDGDDGSSHETLLRRCSGDVRNHPSFLRVGPLDWRLRDDARRDVVVPFRVTMGCRQILFFAPGRLAFTFENRSHIRPTERTRQPCPDKPARLSSCAAQTLLFATPKRIARTGSISDTSHDRFWAVPTPAYQAQYNNTWIVTTPQAMWRVGPLPEQTGIRESRKINGIFAAVLTSQRSDVIRTRRQRGGHEAALRMV